jgi:hypothetical protein
MKDIKQAYLKHKGSMNKILASVVGIEIIDEDSEFFLPIHI